MNQASPSPKRKGAKASPPAERGSESQRIVHAIRRIMRASEHHSHSLNGRFGITTPQLLCLSSIAQNPGGILIKDLAASVFLSPSTVVGIVDRLESRELVRRERSKKDKRLVHVYCCPAGSELLDRAPGQLGDVVESGLAGLPDGEAASMAASLEKLVGLMESNTNGA